MTAVTGPWILALRPKTLTAALVPVVVATALVKAEGVEVKWWISIAALSASFLIQIATNLINDAIDFEKGADTAERVGPVRVTQSGLLTAKQVKRGAGVCLVIAFLIGIPLVLHGGWPIVVIGLLSLALAYGYTGGPFPLAYLGLGDLFVILFFGLIAVMGTHYLHSGVWSVPAAVAGIQIGFLATVLIAINNLRDCEQDRKVGKRTLAARFGVTFAKWEIAVLSYSPFLLGAFYAPQGWKWAAYAPLVAVPLAGRVVRSVWGAASGDELNRALAKAAGLQIVFGFALALGLWVGVR